MKSTLFCTVLAAAMGIATAAPVLTLSPAGPVTGAPGSAVGWGFTLQADPTEWIAVIGSFTGDETNPSLGFYVDFIGSQGGPSGGVLAPGAPDWTQAFDENAFTGLGYFQLLPDAPLLSVNSGNLYILYERFSADPTVCGACQLGSAELVVPFSINVDSNVPEPASLLLLGAGLTALAALRARRV
jgi:hypothetical protein